MSKKIQILILYHIICNTAIISKFLDIYKIKEEFLVKVQRIFITEENELYLKGIAFKENIKTDDQALMNTFVSYLFH